MRTKSVTTIEWEVRRVRGLWTQAEFAKQLGVATRTVSRWEGGLSRPAYKYARALVERGAEISVFLPTGGPQSDSGVAA